MNKITDLAKPYFCMDRSIGKLLKRIFIRLRHFTMDSYAGSVEFFGPGPSLIWDAKTNSEPIKTSIQRRLLRWLGHIFRMSHNRIPRVALRWTPKVKESRTDQKPTGEEQSRKRLRQSYWVRQK